MPNKKNKKKVNPIRSKAQRASTDPIKSDRASNRVKIIYDRQNCIGAGSCAVVAPQFWKMKKDNKANLINSKINKKTGNYELELEVDEEELALLKDSQDACPVRVIKVIHV